MPTLVDHLRRGAAGDLLPWAVQRSAMAAFGLGAAAVEAAALEAGLLPARYQRNRQTLSTADQLRLLRSAVAVVGCGGLGGYVIEELARLGVGQIVAIDPDRFEEHNLNRQLLSSPAALGETKVTAAARRVGEINPAVQLTPVEKAFAADNGRELLAGASVVVDALDSIAVRLELADTCSAMGIPLVHGAIGGWFGHLATQLPGDDTLRQIYRSWNSGKGIEQQYGNPSFTPAVVASLEVAEVCKLLLGQGELLRNRQLTIDLLTMEIHEIQLRKAERSPA